MNNEFRWTHQSLSYTWRELASRAGVSDSGTNNHGFESLGMEVYYASPEKVHPSQTAIIVAPCDLQTWYGLLERQADSLDWVPLSKALPEGVHLSFDDPLPVLFWGKGYEGGQKPFGEKRADGSLVFYVDILASVFFMLSRWEETVIQARDEHDRFPSYYSVAFKQGFLDRPIVDEYALVLRAWLNYLNPQWKPIPRQFEIRLSHDIDQIQEYKSYRNVIMRIWGDIISRHSIRLAWQHFFIAWQHLFTAIMGIFAPRRALYFNSIQLLVDLSSTYGLYSVFNFMAADVGHNEGDYDIFSPIVNEAITSIQKQGFTIGFHPGYRTYNNPQLMAKEKARMDKILRGSQYGGHQHYLRFKVPDTWRILDEVGVVYDSTMVYADNEGFRCGTCHPFRPFDIQKNREFSLLEIPLIVMDKTFFDNRKLSIQQAEERILQLAYRCKQVEGIFHLLWHNTSLVGQWLLWGEMYKRLLVEFKSMQ